MLAGMVNNSLPCSSAWVAVISAPLRAGRLCHQHTLRQSGQQSVACRKISLKAVGLRSQLTEHHAAVFQNPTAQRLTLCRAGIIQAGRQHGDRLSSRFQCSFQGAAVDALRQSAENHKACPGKVV